MQPRVREKKTKWRVKGKWCRLILFSFYDPIFFHDPSLSESDFISFLCFYLIRVGPSLSELIQPWLAVRVDPVRLLYLPFHLV